MADLNFGYEHQVVPPNLWYVLFLHYSTSSLSMVKLH